MNGPSNGNTCRPLILCVWRHSFYHEHAKYDGRLYFQFVSPRGGYPVSGPRSLPSLWSHVLSRGYPLSCQKSSSRSCWREVPRSLVPGPFLTSGPMSFWREGYPDRTWGTPPKGQWVPPPDRTGSRSHSRTFLLFWWLLTTESLVSVKCTGKSCRKLTRSRN